MSKSNLYRVHVDTKVLQSVKEVKFSDFGFKERFDIQEWIESTPEILGEELLVIAKEKSYFEGTRERPDLIALDKTGNIVVVELKRDDSGKEVEWQSIKYASYWSKFKTDKIVEVFADYLNQRGKTSKELEETNAKQRIIEFVNDESLDNINTKQRIILVSHNFAIEVTSAVNWLIDKNNIDIKCVQLIPYYDSDKQAHYLQANQILPVGDIDDLMITASGKNNNVMRGVSSDKKNDKVTKFFEGIRDELLNILPRDLAPEKYSKWAGTEKDYRYYHFWYKTKIWDNWDNSYKVWYPNEDHKDKEWVNNFSVFLSMSKKHLLNHGVTEVQLDNLIIYLRKLNLSDFEYSEESNSINFECWVPNNQFSDKTKHEIVEKLKMLIEVTKPYISKIESYF